MIVQVPFSWEHWFWSRVFVRSVGVKLANMTFVFAFFFDFKAQNLWVEMNILNPGSRDTSQKLTLKQSPFTTSNTERQLSNVRQINLSNENIKNKHWCFQISKIVSQKKIFWHFDLHFVLKTFIWDIFQITEQKQQAKRVVSIISPTIDH